MYNIELNATEEQVEVINKYINNKDINLSQELLKKAMELIEDYEDVQKALKSIEESSYRIIYNKKSRNQFNKLDKSIKIKIAKYIEKNLENTDKPKAFGKPLSNNLKNLWRYRVDNFRIIAEIRDSELIILIVEIDKLLYY